MLEELGISKETLDYIEQEELKIEFMTKDIL